MRRRVLLVGGLCALLSACAMRENAVDRVEFDVQGSRLFMAGEVTSRTPGRFRKLVEQNPYIDTIVLTQMPGALDDEAVSRIGYRIREMGLATHLNAQSVVHSEAVDLFLSGTRRSMEDGAVIGVNSWADGAGEGALYPRDSPEHQSKIAFTRDMLGSAAFYWFCLQAAASDGIHEMTRAEITRFGLLTEPIRD